MSFELLTLSLNSEGYIQFFVVHPRTKDKQFREVKKCGVKLLYAKDNDLRRDAIVDRDQRLNAMNCSVDGCLSCCLGFCPRYRKIDDYKRLSETLDSCSPHSELYKQQLAIPYTFHRICTE